MEAALPQSSTSGREVMPLPPGWLWPQRLLFSGAQGVHGAGAGVRQGPPWLGTRAGTCSSAPSQQWGHLVWGCSGFGKDVHALLGVWWPTGQHGC